MARSYGRLFASIWNDEDFRPLSVGAKLMYGFLISQDDLDALRHHSAAPRRWALDLASPLRMSSPGSRNSTSPGTSSPTRNGSELLVRSLIRRDDIWKQPNVFKAAASSAKASKSTADQGRSLRRGPAPRPHPHQPRDAGHCREIFYPSGTLRESFAKPSRGVSEGCGNHSGGDAGSHGEAHGGDLRRVPGGPVSALLWITRPDRRIRRSEPFRNPYANPSRTIAPGPRGRGVVVYLYRLPFPIPLPPPPRPRRNPSARCGRLRCRAFRRRRGINPGMKIRIYPDSSPRSARSAPPGRRSRSSVLSPTRPSRSAPGGSCVPRCLPSPVIPARSSPGGLPTTAPGGRPRLSRG